jgi:hypothetical protein
MKRSANGFSDDERGNPRRRLEPDRARHHRAGARQAGIALEDRQDPFGRKNDSLRAAEIRHFLTA